MISAIKLLRKDSLGVDGTYRNAKHHAQNLIPIIDALVKELPMMNFKEWGQAHNVHTVTTWDNRKFIFRPYSDEGGYAGITLSVKTSRSKESEVFLFKTTPDENQINNFIWHVKALGRKNPNYTPNVVITTPELN